MTSTRLVDCEINLKEEEVAEMLNTQLQALLIGIYISTQLTNTRVLIVSVIHSHTHYPTNLISIIATLVERVADIATRYSGRAPSNFLVIVLHTDVAATQGLCNLYVEALIEEGGDDTIPLTIDSSETSFYIDNNKLQQTTLVSG